LVALKQKGRTVDLSEDATQNCSIAEAMNLITRPFEVTKESQVNLLKT
jgi:hypothetical protein